MNYKPEENKLTVMVGVRLTNREKKKLEHYAKEWGCTLTDAVRYLMYKGGWADLEYTEE